MKNKDNNDNSFQKFEKKEEAEKEIGLEKSNNLAESQTEFDNKNNDLDLNEDSYNSDEKKSISSNGNVVGEKVSAETNSQKDLIKKPFNKNGLLSKCHLKLASYIEQNKDITLAGTKRFTDKSGEYYLKNVQLKKKKGQSGALSKRLSLRTPQNPEIFRVLS